jgi:hypothetical protein
MLTQNQQQTIQFITETFEKLNKASEPKKFNLVNTNLLIDKTERIKALDREEAEERRIWEHLACDEGSRIAELFREDLPGDKVVVFDAQNQIKICRQDVQEDGSVYTHHFGRCCIEIRVNVKYGWKEDEYGIKRKEYIGLYYTTGYEMNFETIEELVSSSYFTERLRTEILD